MDYITMQNAVLERFAETDRPNAKLWINMAGAMLWNAANWTFKYGNSNATVTTGTAAVTGLPSDLGMVRSFYNRAGDPLYCLNHRDWNDLYRGMVIAQTTGTPESYMVTGGNVFVGPPSNVTDTFYYLEYRKRYTQLVGDTDISAIPTPYHWVQVAGAMSIGQSHQQDPTATLLDPIVQAGLQAMKGDYLSDAEGDPSYWGDLY